MKIGRFLANNYNTLLLITVLYVAFNYFFRDPLLEWIFGTPGYKSVTDADAYARETFLRNVISIILLVLMVVSAIVSAILLFETEAKHISRFVLIGVILFVVVCFFLALISGNLM